jgi:hypothetical protein
VFPSIFDNTKGKRKERVSVVICIKINLGKYIKKKKLLFDIPSQFAVVNSLSEYNALLQPISRLIKYKFYHADAIREKFITNKQSGERNNTNGSAVLRCAFTLNVPTDY